MFLGRKIYYDKLTGNVVLEIGERHGDIIETTIEQDFECFAELSQRVPETVGLIKLEYGQLKDNFRNCSSYRIDINKSVIDATAIVFSYDHPIPEPTLEEETLAVARNTQNGVETVSMDNLITMDMALEINNKLDAVIAHLNITL